MTNQIKTLPDRNAHYRNKTVFASSSCASCNIVPGFVAPLSLTLCDCIYLVRRIRTYRLPNHTVPRAFVCPFVVVPSPDFPPEHSFQIWIYFLKGGGVQGCGERRRLVLTVALVFGNNVCLALAARRCAALKKVLSSISSSVACFIPFLDPVVAPILGVGFAGFGGCHFAFPRRAWVKMQLPPAMACPNPAP